MLEGGWTPSRPVWGLTLPIRSRWALSSPAPASQDSSAPQTPLVNGRGHIYPSCPWHRCLSHQEPSKLRCHCAQSRTELPQQLLSEGPFMPVLQSRKLSLREGNY